MARREMTAQYTKDELIRLCTDDIIQVSTLLDKYRQLANLHNTNFIISHYWLQIPASIRRALKKYPDDEMSGLLLRYEWQNEKSNDDENEASEELSNTESNLLLNLPRQMTPDGALHDSDPPLTWHHSQLESFMCEAASCQLDRLRYTRACQSISQSMYNQKSSAENDNREDPFINHAMGEKKSHEVEIMASMCARVAETCNISHVVDLGSGKGYLSTTLSLQHKLSVIGIDSQEGNTHGAMQRKTRLEKYYGGLVRKEKEKSAETKRDKKKRRKEMRLLHSKSASQQDAAPSLDPPANPTHVDSSEGGTSPSLTETPQYTEKSGYTAVTAYIGPDDDLDKYTTPTFPHNTPVMLTGLHTCGNLAVSSAKLFLHSKSCDAMVNVSCCYHQIDEMFYKNPFSDGNNEAMPHFPMSYLLQEKKFWLGRNARMLSLQAMEKAVVLGVGGGTDITLYWRALLQKILLDIHGYWRKDWIVGKISGKCANFHEYVRRALKKLKVEREITDDEISEYLSKFEEARQHMAMFFQLRIALSPAIESIILLDRCLYLLQQDNTSTVLLCKLFDAVQSPRCYAIIAAKSCSSQLDVS